MITALDILFIGLSLVSLGCLAYGVVRKGLCPRWLLLVAAVPPMAFALWSLYTYWFWWNAGDTQGFGRQWLAGRLYTLLAVGLLALAALVPGRGWGRRVACLLALAIPAPLMVMILLETMWILGWAPRL